LERPTPSLPSLWFAIRREGKSLNVEDARAQTMAHKNGGNLVREGEELRE